MSKEQIALVGSIAVLAVGALYFMRSRAEASAAESGKDVTKSTQGGLKTTPIKSSAVAFVEKPLEALSNVIRKVVQIPSAVAQDTRILQPYGSAESARGAYTAPIRPDYAPTIRARDTIVYADFGR